MKLIKLWSALPSTLRDFIHSLSTDNAQKSSPIEEYDELTAEEIERLYTEIGGEG